MRLVGVVLIALAFACAYVAMLTVDEHGGGVPCSCP